MLVRTSTNNKHASENTMMTPIIVIACKLKNGCRHGFPHLLGLGQVLLEGGGHGAEVTSAHAALKKYTHISYALRVSEQKAPSLLKGLPALTFRARLPAGPSRSHAMVMVWKSDHNPHGYLQAERWRCRLAYPRRRGWDPRHCRHSGRAGSVSGTRHCAIKARH